MKDYTSPKYYKYRENIKTKRDKGIAWEDIIYACKKTEEELSDFLALFAEINDTEQITNEDWKELVNRAKKAEEEAKAAEYVDTNSMIVDEGQDNEAFVPPGETSAWQMYRKHLIKQGFKEAVVDEMERSTLRTLKRLSSDTTNISPIKGLVVGNVQSGKTANMEALMAMAADWGWNMFIILSGTIENLRRQTQSRMLNDLACSGGDFTWKGLEKLSKNCEAVNRAQYLQFQTGAHDRYFTVCLKNSTRLSNLIQWINEDQNKKSQMRILLIDDEADQAGVNTKKIMSDAEEQERNRINQLIINLVSGLSEKGKATQSGYKAMNYIGYTATPYATILNESRLESLYPRNFISTLSVSKEYFGPQQIFGADGSDYDGMDIVRIIETEELKRIELIHKGRDTCLPVSVENALCWFLCCTAVMRHWEYSKPVSMLIHTSQKQAHHRYMYQTVKTWFEKTDSELVEKCRAVWKYETERFTFDNFRAQYFDYSEADDKIGQYPEFETLIPYIKELLRRITNIPLGDEGELEYHSGVHICVDNCSNNGLNEDGMYMRLVYPDKGKSPCYAPAFVVIGGATLSRGLTIEGVVSTVFLRTIGQADTLMQMGRWFGYRKGYELLPRIWITQRTQEQFVFLSTLDQELRDEIYYMDKAGMSPSEYGPRVKNTPMYSFIRITAANRMQMAQTAVYDFSGSKNQTFLFDNDKTMLESNIIVTEDFIEKMGTPIIVNNRHSSNSLIWKNISHTRIIEYLKLMTFSKRMRIFNDIDSISEWIIQLTEKGELSPWNVIASGTATGKEWYTPYGVLHKSSRTRKTNIKVPDDSVINIGVLRKPEDLVADIDESALSDIYKPLLDNFKTKDADILRDKAGMSTIPQLIIYRIDKDSKVSGNFKNREDLNAPEDIIGICLNIPGMIKGRNHAAKIQIRLDETFADDGDIQEMDT